MSDDWVNDGLYDKELDIVFGDDGNPCSGLDRDEEWKRHPTFERLFVSDLGRVWRVAFVDIVGRKFKAKMAKLTVNKHHGYMVANVEGRPRRVHRLVLETFVGPPPSDHEDSAMHANDIKTDNRLSNLSWGSHRQNLRDEHQVHDLDVLRGAESDWRNRLDLGGAEVARLHGVCRYALQVRYGSRKSSLELLVLRARCYQLRLDGLSTRAIGRELGISGVTAHHYSVHHARANGLPLIEVSHGQAVKDGIARNKNKT